MDESDGGGDGEGGDFSSLRESTGGRSTRNAGILRVDVGGPSRRTQTSEPSSPQPSIDRLSVSFARDEKSISEGSEGRQGVNTRERATSLPFNVHVSNMADGEISPVGVASGSSGMRLSVTGVPGPGTDEEDDYSASVTAILHRRASSTVMKKPRLGKRRTSSPFDSDRRRSSVFTTSSGESTAITMEGQEGEITQEQIFENIRLHKEVLESVKQQPWEMRRKIKLVQQAKEYVRRHEGHLQERLAQSKSTKDFMASFNIILMRWWQWMKREFGNLAVNLIPWELRIKEIESHFGSVVASYFTFLRWVFWINIVMTSIIICLIIVPEVLAGDASKAGMRKEIQEYDKPTAYDLSTLWDFEGVLKYSPMFYGYYTNEPKTSEGYPLPLSYFLTGLGIYVYSFVAILRKMAKNSRQSKLSEKDDECIFSWKVFTGWDYMIGNPETAFNRFASITMGFKEALLEEKEKKKDERNWKVVSLRVLANVLVMMLLITSAWAVIEVVQRSGKIDPESAPSWWRQNEITLVMSLITTVFPNLFEVVGMLEKYHPRKQLRWQLARIMVLNFLNLYTLMIALFGKVTTMTEELEKLRPPNSTVLPSTLSPNVNECVDVSVNCTLLNEFRFNQTLKKTTEILTFLTTVALMTKYNPNGTLGSLTPPLSALDGSRRTDNESIAARFNQKEWWDILHRVIPKLDRTSSSPDLSRFHSEVEDYENLTLFTLRPGISINETLRMIPGNTTALKVALPLLLKLVMTLVPQRPFQVKSTTPAFFNSTNDATTSSSSDFSTWTERSENEIMSSSSTWDPGTVKTTEAAITVSLLGNSTSESSISTTTPMTPNISFTSSVTTTTQGIRNWRVRPSRRPPFDRNAQVNQRKSEGKNRLWRDLRHVPVSSDTVSVGSDSTSLNGEDVTDFDDSSKMSTRGDIPGDLSEADYVTSTMPIPTSTSPPLPDDSEKLLTTIFTTIRFIASHNSSRTDFPDLSTLEEYAEFVTNYKSDAKTHITRDPYNTSFTSSFNRTSDETETRSCFVKACENGTIDPGNIMEFLNCSNLACAMKVLLGPRNPNTPPDCIIPGSRSCMTTESPTTMDPEKNRDLGKLCWETMFGQELVKLTVMDLIFTVAVILVLDFIRAILVRMMNPCWCWDLEKKFPQYGDFKIAENILHLVNNQGMIWMGMFFAPGLPAINIVKLVILMYIRSWTVMTCNVPHETIFRASRSNNFYFALLLFMLFLCVLPVGYAIVRLTPSWHCGPFSNYRKIYKIFTTALLKALPEATHNIVNYIASPGIIIPLLLLLVLVIYYLLSLTSSLREANNDLKIQLRRERTEERRKMFKMAGGSKDKDNALSRWQAIIPTVKSKPGAPRLSILTSGKQTGFAGLAKRATLKARELSQQSQSHGKSPLPGGEEDGNGTDVDQVSLPEDVVGHGHGKQMPSTSTAHKSLTRKPSTTDSVASPSEIPLIKISKEGDGTVGIKPRKDKAIVQHVPTQPQSMTTESTLPTTSCGAGKKGTQPIQHLSSTVTPTQIPKLPMAEAAAQPPSVAAEPTRRERILKALISRSKKGRTLEGTLRKEAGEMRKGRRVAESPTPGSASPVGCSLNQEHLLDMEEVGIDIRPLFVQFQTGFEGTP